MSYFNKIILYHKTDKEMIKGYKYRLDPTPEQIVQMEKTFGCCRYVYNWALDLKIKTYQGEKRSLSEGYCFCIMERVLQDVAI